MSSSDTALQTSFLLYFELPQIRSPCFSFKSDTDSAFAAETKMLCDEGRWVGTGYSAVLVHLHKLFPVLASEGSQGLPDISHVHIVRNDPNTPSYGAQGTLVSVKHSEFLTLQQKLSDVIHPLVILQQLCFRISQVTCGQVALKVVQWRFCTSAEWLQSL